MSTATWLVLKVSTRQSLCLVIKTFVFLLFWEIQLFILLNSNFYLFLEVSFSALDNWGGRQDNVSLIVNRNQSDKLAKIYMFYFLLYFVENKTR